MMNKVCDFWQVFLLIVLWLIGEAIIRLTAVPLPGSIIGMFILLTLLLTGVMRVSSVSFGATFFLGKMLLFLIPASMVLMDHKELLGGAGVKIILIIFASTTLVMIVSGWITHVSFDLMSKYHKIKNNEM